MLKKIFYGSCLLLLLVIQPASIYAQNKSSLKVDSTETKHTDAPIVQYVNGEKHIYVERLNFSPNMTVWEFLQLFPEMIFRGSNDVLSNYSIVMDDYSLGNNRDEVLFQMTLGELKEITITNNPSVSYSQNGVGGVIELVPKSLREGVSGNAQLDVSTEQTVLASANVNYQKDKLKIRSYLKGEFLNVLDKYSHQYFGSTLFNTYDYVKNTIAGTELAKFSVEYAASSKDDITFSIWETYGYKTEQLQEVNRTLSLGTRYDTSYASGVGTLTRFMYQHRFNQYHKLKIGTNYSFSHSVRHLSDNSSSYAQPHSLSTDVRYDGVLVHKGRHQLDLKTGFDFSYNQSKEESPAKPINDYINVSPLLEFRYTLKNDLYVRVGTRYYFDKYRDFLSVESTTSSHDYMLSGEIDYTPADGHTLRLSGMRDRICSSSRQREGYLASGDLSYIFQKSFGNHYLNITQGFQYDHVNMLNGDLYNAFSAKTGIVWQYKVFCLSFTSQLFDNESYRDEIKDYHLYFNLRLTPIFTLPKKWSISVNMMYNSPLMSKVYTEGSYFFASFRVSKQIGSWSFNCEIADPFHYQTKDSYYLSEDYQLNNILYEQQYYYPYRRYINLGIMYQF